MENTLHLHVSDNNNQRITRLGNIEIFHEAEGMTPLGDSTPLDGHVLLVLLHAMVQKKTLRVHGPLSRTMVRNLEELQLIWQRWRPDRYHHIDILPDSIIDCARGPERALAAFSGGVDGTFTALRHARELPEQFRYPLTDVLLVHGFDVSIDHPEYFEALKKRVTPMISDLGLNLRLMRTNSKALRLQDWEDSFSFQLAACFYMFSSEFGYGLIGSGEPYDALVIPWGSSPITAPLMGGDSFNIFHEGAAYSRTEKIAFIARHPLVGKMLKVCWQGENQGENCGVCEKCVRTMLNFAASGYGVPPCFSRDLSLDAVAGIRISNEVQLTELKTIVAYAEKHNISGPWLKTLKARIARGINRPRSMPAKLVIRLLDSLGVKSAVKKQVGHW